MRHGITDEAPGAVLRQKPFTVGGVSTQAPTSTRLQKVIFQESARFSTCQVVSPCSERSVSFELQASLGFRGRFWVFRVFVRKFRHETYILAFPKPQS